MDSFMTASNPEDIRITLTMTKTLKDWQNLRDDISTTYQGNTVRAMINDMVDKAMKSFYPDPEEPTND